MLVHPDPAEPERGDRHAVGVTGRLGGLRADQNCARASARRPAHLRASPIACGTMSRAPPLRGDTYRLISLWSRVQQATASTCRRVGHARTPRPNAAAMLARGRTDRHGGARSAEVSAWCATSHRACPRPLSMTPRVSGVRGEASRELSSRSWSRRTETTRATGSIDRTRCRSAGFTSPLRSSTDPKVHACLVAQLIARVRCRSTRLKRTGLPAGQPAALAVFGNDLGVRRKTELESHCARRGSSGRVVDLSRRTVPVVRGLGPAGEIPCRSLTGDEVCKIVNGARGRRSAIPPIRDLRQR